MIGNFSVCQRSLGNNENLYRAYYCGLCKALSYHIGPLSTFALINDTIFLSLLLSPPLVQEYHTTACLANATHNVHCLPPHHPIVLSGIWMNTVFILCKYYDDMYDDKVHCMKKWLVHKILDRYPQTPNFLEFPEKEIQEAICEQTQREKEVNVTYEDYIEPIAKFSCQMFTRVFASNTSEESCFFRSLGRLYAELTALYDGLQDYVHDKKNGQFNIFSKLEIDLGEKGAIAYVQQITREFNIISSILCPKENKTLFQQIFCRNFAIKLQKWCHNYQNPQKKDTSYGLCCYGTRGLKQKRLQSGIVP